MKYVARTKNEPIIITKLICHKCPFDIASSFILIAEPLSVLIVSWPSTRDSWIIIIGSVQSGHTVQLLDALKEALDVSKESSAEVCMCIMHMYNAETVWCICLWSLLMLGTRVERKENSIQKTGLEKITFILLSILEKNTHVNSFLVVVFLHHNQNS